MKSPVPEVEEQTSSTPTSSKKPRIESPVPEIEGQMSSTPTSSEKSRRKSAVSKVEKQNSRKPLSDDNQGKFPCPFCDKSFLRIGGLIHHCSIHEQYIFYRCVCDICGETLKTTKALSLHLTKHERRIVILCSVCGRKFPNHRSVSEHRMIHKDIANFHLCLSKLTNPWFPMPEKIYKCDRCVASFSNEESLKVHVEEFHPLQFLCQFCEMGFTEISLLMDHCQVHDEFRFKRFQCPLCEEVKTSLVDVEFHASLHEKRKVHLCGLCGEKFHKGDDKRDHLESHRGKEVPLRNAKEILIETAEQTTNDRSQRSSGSMRRINNHDSSGSEDEDDDTISVEESEEDSAEENRSSGIPMEGTSDDVTPDESGAIPAARRWDCRTCNLTFNFSKERWQHVADWHSKWFCWFCDSRFRRKIALSRHTQKKHRRKCPIIGRLRCKICRTNFETIENLEVDLSRHSSKQIFLCCVCGQRFTAETDRELHERSHRLDI